MALNSNLRGLDFWRLADELSVIDAAFLTLMLEPGDFQLVSPASPMTSQIRQTSGWGGYDGVERIEFDDGTMGINPSEFRAVFKALRAAILSDKLRAKIGNLGRHPDYCWFGSEYFPVDPNDDESALDFGFVLSWGDPTLFSNSDSILSGRRLGGEGKLYVLKEPDWYHTSVGLEDLQDWFKSRGVAPLFFFPEGVADGFRDKNHARYSPKLATAVAAWEHVNRPGKNKSVKQTLADWTVSNGVNFGLGNDDGAVSATVAEEIAKIANWHTSGGATPTHTEVDETDGGVPYPVQNFEEVLAIDLQNGASGNPSLRDIDDEPPF